MKVKAIRKYLRRRKKRKIKGKIVFGAKGLTPFRIKKRIRKRLKKDNKLVMNIENL